MCIYILLIYSLFDRHLGFFPIVENAAVNNGVQVFVQIYVFIFLGYIPRCRIVRSYSNSFLAFWGTAKLFSPTPALFVIPPVMYEASSFSTSSPFYCVCASHSSECEVVVLVCIFLVTNEIVFSCAVGHLHIFLRRNKCLFKSFAHF